MTEREERHVNAARTGGGRRGQRRREEEGGTEGAATEGGREGGRSCSSWMLTAKVHGDVGFVFSACERL